jgi:hypothetical protein|uniref:Uncharacterized protein n=1 Tax=Zea mays TaxID=4577 RepID=C0HGJ7_MAIZE|nr:unknown [Zea mays]
MRYFERIGICLSAYITYIDHQPSALDSTFSAHRAAPQSFYLT